MTTTYSIAAPKVGQAARKAADRLGVGSVPERMRLGLLADMADYACRFGQENRISVSLEDFALLRTDLFDIR